jgi:hypothetical protein
MKCPRCDETLPFDLCPDCSGEIPEKSLYCCWCGHPIQRIQREEETDFSERKLCSDGNCIGVINEQGRCNICGKPYTGEPK